MEVPFTVTELLVSLLFAIEPASMVLVTVPVSPVVTSVPVVAGIVTTTPVPEAAADLRFKVPEVAPEKLAPPPPMVGVVSEGEVPNTKAPEPVSSLMTPASSEDVVAANAESLLAVYATVPPVPKATEDESVPVNVSVLLAVSVLPLATVKVPVELVIVSPLILVAVAAPRLGVVREGLVAKTNAPEPVSSEITPASCEDVVAANCANVPPVVAIVPACRVVLPSAKVRVRDALRVVGTISTV